LSYHSEVFNGAVELLYQRWSELIHWRPQLNDYNVLKRYADAIGAAGWGRGRVWGAIDGTFMGFCRPENSDNQLRTYSGYYKGNGLKYQVVPTPDGLISHVYGPALGPANDWDIWGESAVEHQLRATFEGRQTLFLYGDNAYRECYGVVPPFHDQRGFRWLSHEELQANSHLSSQRIMAENVLGKAEQFWTYNHFEQSLRSAAQPVGLYFLIGVFLQNILTCLNGSEDLIAKRFNCPPPTVAEYLGLNVGGDDFENGN
jgi:hypothetical protein